jgi:hypothetical protein
MAVSPAPRDVLREMTRLQKEGIFKPPKDPLPPGGHGEPIRLDLPTLRKLAPGAAGRALGQGDGSQVTEVIWSEGGDQLSIDPAKIDVNTIDGAILISIPVRCDQSGEGVAAAGSPAVVTFDVDLSAVKDKGLVLLVAVVDSKNDHVSLTESSLHDLTLASPHVVVRSVLVRT